MRRIIFITMLAAVVGVKPCAAQVTTSCSLYGNTAQCTSNDHGSVAAEQQREADATGQAIGRSIGLAIFRTHFPGWRRKYCSKHPAQPFVYANAAGDSISGTCPTTDGLANEVAAEWRGKHSDYQATPANGTAMVGYLIERRLSPLESRSYDQAFRYLKANGPRNTGQASSSSSPAKDLFVWFDEPAPQVGAPLFEVVVTARAYDGALATLRQVRKQDTAVQAGTSVLDSGYHPATVNLDSWQKDSPNATPTLFYWQGEDVTGATPVMHFQMTRRAYEQMLALLAGSDLRMRPLQ